MRVAIVTESFFPQINGVTNTVRHTVDRLLETGHQPLIIAPGPGLTCYRNVRVVRARSVGLPGYLASPVMLGAIGLRAARKLGVPTVAVYQTDVSGFVRQYGIPAEAPIAKWVGRIHRRSNRTLVPSSASYTQLETLGVTNMHVWGRGVSLDLFGPERRNPQVHAHWTRRRPGDIVVGYVGRLAHEKQVRRLAELADIPGTRMVIVGDGPARGWLEKRLPDAKFTGMLRGEDLAQAFACLDLFVHTGETETFCQTVQEAMASGVPVVAPAAGGPLDVVVPGRTGLLYDPADPASLRRTVASLVGDAELRQRFAQNALTQVASRSWASVVDELVDVHYAPLLAIIGEDAA
jgi:phosphatidylinositol alpha 1,6-mannosyltransferase